MFATSTDGTHWSQLEPVVDRRGAPVPGIFEQDPRSLPDGRILSAFHLQPGLLAAPFYTDDPSGTRGWTRGRMENLPYAGSVSREIEPSWFSRSDDSIVMVFRDQAESFRKLASVSVDRGASWTAPVITNMPDARTKQSAGNLPDGTAFLVGNPVGNRSRYPLVVALSQDGRIFDRAWLLRAGGEALPALRYDGQYKRQGYSYPKSAVIGDWLYVAYATNKEDIELTRIPLSSLQTP
jgi:predicted neuraminidase